MSYHGQGQFGFTYQVPSVQSDAARKFTKPVLSATSPDPCGTTWGITLASWAAPSGVRAELGVKSLRCRITWGGGNEAGSGADICEIDYPSGGTVVCVHGATVKVDIVGEIEQAFVSTVSPQLAGWLSQGRTSERAMCATLTEDLVVIPTVYTVPPRARAFRIMTTFGDMHHIEALQLSGNATPLDQAVDIVATEDSDAFFNASNRAAWFPLAPQTTTLSITTDDIVEARVQWLLELS